MRSNQDPLVRNTLYSIPKHVSILSTNIKLRFGQDFLELNSVLNFETARFKHIKHVSLFYIIICGTGIKTDFLELWSSCGKRGKCSSV